MDDAYQAIMIAFSVLVFVIALSVSVYLISQVTNTSEQLAFYADSTKFYDNIELERRPDEPEIDFKERKERVYSKSIRYVSAETIIPTLYRYSKENFCVKIYDDDGCLVQLFDLDVEGKMRTISQDTNTDPNQKPFSKAFKRIYDSKDYNKPTHSGAMDNSGYYLYGNPWGVNPDNIRKRIDLFVSGQAGIIGDSRRVDYRNNAFARSLKALELDGKTHPENYMLWTYREEFISYTYAGEFTENDNGDILVTGAKTKDKIIIIYTLQGTDTDRRNIS